MRARVSVPVAYLYLVRPSQVRLRQLKWWFAGLYLAWSLLVYFGSTKEHQWWPLFLYPLILPWSILFDFVGDRVFQWLAPHPATSDFVLFDCIEGALYIVGGTVWFWYVGKFIEFITHDRSAKDG